MSVFTTRNFVLANGSVLPVLEIAYELYGEMADDRSNVILVAHGISSSHHAAGPPTLDRRRGWYAEIIGPGKLLDTDRYCIVSSNTLGSCYGSTGPASANPLTGDRYGLSFPEICYEDIVRAQHLLLVSLRVTRLVAVVGSSIGGYQTFQWAVTFPEFMSAVLALDTAPKDPFDATSIAARLAETFSSDPHWNGGDYRAGSMVEALTTYRVEMLRSYGFEEKLGDVNTATRQSILSRTAHEWAVEFDPLSLIALFRAGGTFNVESDLAKIAAPLMYVLCDTDEWFPASLGKAVMVKLQEAGVDAQFLQIHSDLGHYATTEEPQKWVPQAQAFLKKAAIR